MLKWCFVEKVVSNSSYIWRPILFQQLIVKVVHLDIMRGGALDTLIPNKLLQYSMFQETAFLPG